ncbi:MAG: hypothetical protein Pg6A_16880 [Termitinemataceae bacterium]|nr:MAG: hypothetical protein Pg6A_16880 [Termitinemataceae bacterium]
MRYFSSDILKQSPLRVVRLLISNAFLFFGVSALLLNVLFASGNSQSFSDDSMFLLLRLLYWNGIILFIFAMLSIFLTVVIHWLKKDAKRNHFLFYAIFALAGLIMMLFAGGVIVLSEGNL